MFSILPFWDNVVGGEIPRLFFSSLAAAKVEREGGKGAEKPILGREKGGKQILLGGWGRKGEGEIFIRDPTKFFRRNLHHSKKVAETMKKSNVPFRGKEGENKHMSVWCREPTLGLSDKKWKYARWAARPHPSSSSDERRRGARRRGKRRKEPLFIYLPLYL